MRFPWPYPPRGALLAALVLAYLLPGLIGHDPAKADDLVHFGVVHAMLADGHWLLPHLAGVPYYDHPPLYYWLAAALAKTAGMLLGADDAARLASGVCIALMIGGVASAAHSYFGADSRSAGAFLAYGILGLLVHAHDTQPMSALLAAWAWTLAGAGVLRERAGLGAAVLALALAGGLLGAGLAFAALALPLVLLLPALHRQWRTPASLTALVAVIALALVLAALWLLALRQVEPAALQAFVARQVELYLRPDQAAGTEAMEFLGLLSWFAWPALPLALWALWRARHALGQPGIVVALCAFALALALQSLTQGARSLSAQPLLPPLALLAAAAAPHLRRGAANALDWFAMATFSLLAALVWLGWIAMLTGWPARTARKLATLQPGFTLQFEPLLVLVAALVTAAWIWLMLASPRSALRGTVHWAVGVTVVWALVMTLWLPWVDHARSYRSVAESLRAALPAHQCIGGRGLDRPQRAAFHIHAGVITRSAGAASPCPLLLSQDDARKPARAPAGGWQLLWEGRRPGDRDEVFRLYTRQP